MKKLLVFLILVILSIVVVYYFVAKKTDDSIKTPGGKKFPLYLIISAPSGCGKSVIMNKLLSKYDNFYRVISVTTRDKRPGEVDGVDYHYVSSSDFDVKLSNGEFMEHTEVYGNKYGIYKKDIEKADSEGKVIMFDVDEHGMAQLKLHLESQGLRVVTVYILPPSIDVLRKRLEGRKTDSAEVIEKRMNIAKEKISFYRSYDYQLVNENIDSTVYELLSITNAEQKKTTGYRYYIDGLVKNEISGN